MVVPKSVFLIEQGQTDRNSRVRPIGELKRRLTPRSTGEAACALLACSHQRGPRTTGRAGTRSRARENRRGVVACNVMPKPMPNIDLSGFSATGLDELIASASKPARALVEERFTS